MRGTGASFLAGAVALTWVGEANAQLRLDKLNACASIAALYEKLDHQPRATNCRASRSTLERALDRRAFPAGGACFLEDPPADFLSGFSCLGMHAPGSQIVSSYLCIRQTPFSTVASYVSDFDNSLAPAISNYLTSAAACPANGRNASHIGTSTFPMPVLFIAQAEFGFAAKRQSSTSSMISHGFASLDPDILGPGQAVEYFNIFVDGEYGPRGGADPLQWGSWSLVVDELEELEEAANALARQHGQPNHTEASSYEILSQTGRGETRDDKTDRVSSWLDVLEYALIDSDLYYLTDDELRDEIGMGYDAFSDMIVSGTPYGIREEYANGVGESRMFVDTSEASCARGGAGALVVYVQHSLREEPGSREYGDLLIVIAGGGACSERSSRRHLAAIKQSLIAELQTHLESEQ